jgi:hypothetical protein
LYNRYKQNFILQFDIGAYFLNIEVVYIPLTCSFYIFDGVIVLCSYKFHSLVTGISAVAANESTTLNGYRELLAIAAALQVQASLIHLFPMLCFFLGYKNRPTISGTTTDFHVLNLIANPKKSSLDWAASWL